jgi:hypothetical protein
MKLVIVAAALLVAGAPPATAPQPAPVEPGPATSVPRPSDGMNFHRGRAGCTPILRQVQEASKRADVRRNEARTLDREPPAHLLLAVDRQVNGCREVTFVRRNIAPGGPTPEIGREPGR